jgi:hypothetical protein
MTTSSTPRAGRREWIGLAVLALACLLYVMDLTVVHLAIPSISEDLQPTSAQLPGQLGATLLDIARDAFVAGMQVAATIGAVLAIGIAILAVVMLRNVGSGAEREAAADAEAGGVREDERPCERLPAHRESRGTANPVPEA